MDDKLDFLSSKFDPLKALYNRNLQPPILNIKVFNNLVEYAVAIKEGKTKSTTVSTRNKAQSVKSLAPHAASRTKNLKPEYKPAEKEVLQERLKAIAESKACTAEDRKTGMKMGGRLEDTKLREFMLAEETFKAQQRKKKRMDVIQKMEDLRQGPFRILHTCLTERRRIQVWTRRYKGLRSVLAGYLVAFDKHMNLALFDVDEVYTLEERVERQESPEKTKKKKKRMKKTANALLENEITEEIMKSESADRNSSTMFVIDFQASTKTFLPCTNAKPSSNCSKSTCSNTVESVCDVSKDAFEDSSSPSAKALSTALQTPFFHPVDHAHQSPLTTDDENSASKESEDLKDSKGSDNSVSKNKSDFQTIKTPTRGVSVCVNGNGKNVQIGNEQEPTQTHNFEFMTEMSGETVKEERPLHCTHGEKRIERTENANGSNIMQGETHYIEVHARNLTKLELCGSLETAHCGEASVPFVEDKDCGAIIVRDSRLVDNDTILLRRENNVKHDKEQIERAVAERNSPMTLLECYESGESEENVEKLQGSIECVPLSSKKVDDFIGSVSRDSTVDISSCLSTREPGLPSVNETCGATKATAEKGNNAEAVHEQEESVFADEKFQNRNIILALDGIIQLESESKDLE
ncbi:uncharacterized protein LOC111326036 [Stylophora pistillata]|uniref:uncharacterized protein LOC111326036 n=1 Tax=Stylophora pistillata TaxID=50429 RepID=UPI000C03FBB9|nr:uncharacterized protein LOC111326036 [Stylophora pistillata]